MNRMNRRDTRTIEAEGFRDGTQDVNPERTVKQIEARFARRQEQEDEVSTKRIKTLEAQFETLQRRKDDAERHWGDLEFRTEGMPPQLVLPLCGVLFACAGISGEAIFLAPVMDGFGIADPTFQLIFAAVIVIATSGLFEITKKLYARRIAKIETVENERSTTSESKSHHGRQLGSVIFSGVMTTFAIALVFILGWWRAEEMIYAASVQTGAWKGFLSNSPTLTRAVVVLLTAALPVFVALAFGWGLNGLYIAWEWRKSQVTYKRVGRQLNYIQKSLEKEIETKAARKRVLAQMREEWRQAYLQNYELGQKTGAWKLPLWWVILKIVALVLFLVVLCVLIDPFLTPYLSHGMHWLLYGCVTLGFGVFYAAYAVKARERPTPQQLYRHKATLFRDGTAVHRTNVMPALPPTSAERNGKGSVNYATVERANSTAAS